MSMNSDGSFTKAFLTEWESHIKEFNATYHTDQVKFEKHVLAGERKTLRQQKKTRRLNRKHRR